LILSGVRFSIEAQSRYPGRVSGAISALFLRALRMLALGAGDELRELEVVDVRDRLEQSECGISLAMLHLIHVADVAADFVGDVIRAESPAEPQLCDHGAQSPFRRVALPI